MALEASEFNGPIANTGISMNEILANSVPDVPVGGEIALTSDEEVMYVFPIPGDDPEGTPLECSYFVMDSDIPVFYSFFEGGTAAAGWKRLHCRSSIPIPAREKHDRIWIRPAKIGQTGNIYFTHGK